MPESPLPPLTPEYLEKLKQMLDAVNFAGITTEDLCAFDLATSVARDVEGMNHEDSETATTSGFLQAMQDHVDIPVDLGCELYDRAIVMSKTWGL